MSSVPSGPTRRCARAAFPDESRDRAPSGARCRPSPRCGSSRSGLTGQVLDVRRHDAAESARRDRRRPRPSARREPARVHPRGGSPPPPRTPLRRPAGPPEPGRRSPRPATTRLDGNLLHIHRALRRLRPVARGRRCCSSRTATGLPRQAALRRSASSAACTSSDVAPGRRRQRLPADPRRAASPGDDGRAGLARRGRAQAVRARRDDPAGGARADLPPPLLRLRS